MLGRFVLTCAHVVDDAVGRGRGAEAAPDDTLTVDLPFLNRTGLSTKVVAWYPMRPLADLVRDALSDIAVLELTVEAELPGGLRPEDVDRRAPTPGARFLTYGFPEGYDTGTQASGEVLVSGPGGWLQVRATQDYGYFIRPGFSGAPVFSATAPGGLGDRPRLIGLAAQADQDETVRLAFVLPAQQLCEAWPPLARPYLGLFAFGEEEADLFFGRDAFIAELAAKLEDHPFTAVVGPSGSGKSSAVLAGLVPRLRAEGWCIAVCRPLRNPLRELALGLVPLLDPNAATLDAREALADKWTARLAEDPGRILDLARGLGSGGTGRTLLVIDQFEELFTADAAAPDGAVARKDEVTREEGSPRQAAFLKVLEAIAGQDSRRTTIRSVATLRADFMGPALEIGRLARLLRDTDVKLGPMTAAELSAAIRKPAARFGVAFEAGLVEELVADMKGRPGGLPLLQFALDRLWQRQSGRTLELASYRGADGKGGLETALNDHAEAVLAELRRDREFGAEADARVRRLMLRLVRLGEGEGSPDARAVVLRTDMRAEDWPLVERLAEARLVMIGRDAVDQETAEVVHEALIGAWDSLRGWLDADRAFGLWRQRLRTYLEDYSGKPEEAHLRGSQLAEATGWLARHRDELNDRERDFIEASECNAQSEADLKLREAEERVALAAENQRRAEDGQRLANELAKTAREGERAATEARSQQKRLNTRLLGLLALFFAALLGAGYLAFESRARRLVADEATEAALTAAREAKGRQLGVEALGIQSDIASADGAKRAAALAIEGWRRFPTLAAFRAATTSLRELPVFEIALDGNVAAVAFSPDGEMVAMGDSKTTRLLSIRDRAEIARIDHGVDVWAIAFSPDSMLLASGSLDNTARLVRTTDGNEVARVDHDGTVFAVAFNRDGTLLATGSSDGTARLIHTTDGSEVARVQHGGSVLAVAFSPDGTLLGTGSSDGTARLIRVRDGTEIARIEHDGGVNSIAFNPDGTLIATGSDDSTVRLARTADGSEVARIEHDDLVSTVAFSPDGRLLATGGNDGVRLFRTSDSSEAAPFEQAGAVHILAFSPDGTLLAAGGSSARLIRISDRREIARFGHDGSVSSLAFSPDGTVLVTGSQSGTARLLPVAVSNEVAGTWRDGDLKAVALSPDGTLLATGSANGTTRLVRVSDGSELTHAMHPGLVTALAFSPDGAVLASVNNRTLDGVGTTRLIRTADGGELAHLDSGEVVALAFSPDDTLLATGGWDYAARLVRISDGSEVARIELDSAVIAMDFSPDSTLLAAGGRDGTVRLIRTTDGSVVARMELGGAINTVAFSPDGTLLATGGWDNLARLLRTADGREVTRVEQSAAVNAVSFSPDGALLATGGGDGTARLIRTLDGSEAARVQSGGSVNTVGFSPDGKLLASGSYDGSARLFRTIDGTEVARMEHSGAVRSVAFNPDGTLFVTGSDGEAAHIWLMPDVVLRALCAERIGGNLSAEDWVRYVGQIDSWMPSCSEWPSDPDLVATWQDRHPLAKAAGGKP